MSHTSDLSYRSQFDSSPGPCTFDNSDSPEISFKLPRLAIANFCSVRNKQAGLELFLDNQDIHLLIGTESHLNDTIFDSEVFPRNYSVFRKDRSIHGGGVFILVEKSIPSSILEIDSTCEVIWVLLHLQHSHDIILGAFYAPPNSPSSVWDELSESLTQVRQKFPTTMIVLGGDFNCPGVDWSSGSLMDSYVTSTFRESLITLAHDFMLEQTVNLPTRGNNILDLCFTTHPDYIHQCITVSGFSDHETVIVELANLQVGHKNVQKKIYLYNRANWDIIKEKVSTVSDMYLTLNENSSRTVEQNWNFIHESILQIVKDHIPAKQISTSSRLLWMTSQLKRLIKRKQRCISELKDLNALLIGKHIKTCNPKYDLL
ncbi:uncharacterized protein [Dysidea avara]|uniref:uncharacterized protein n=1 Tax=Dysidea avara TaxID=196820 RepID=UPI00331E5239